MRTRAILGRVLAKQPLGGSLLETKVILNLKGTKIKTSCLKERVGVGGQSEVKEMRRVEMRRRKLWQGKVEVRQEGQL